MIALLSFAKQVYSRWFHSTSKKELAVSGILRKLVGVPVYECFWNDQITGKAIPSGVIRNLLQSLIGMLFIAFGCLSFGAFDTPPRGTVITAFTNPVPTAFGRFGYSVASLGSDRVFIGAPGNFANTQHGGAAYLFHTNGTLLLTITNHIGEAAGSFADVVSTIGDLLYVTGKAGYLYDTNGALISTLTNPQPQTVSYFGSSVAAIGRDRLLVGAGFEEQVTNRASAFLFRTNGQLLATISDPNPGQHWFGRGLTHAFGGKLVIGSPFTDAFVQNTGAAYTFDTNGVLLGSFTNTTPAPFDNFGHSVQAVGQDRVLIGVVSDSSLVGGSGAAHLFDESGNVLASFKSPFPSINGGFGASFAVLGSDQLLIGAPIDDDVTHAGAAYLFSTNAVPLAMFINPTTTEHSSQYLQFAHSLAAVGDSAVLIGSPADTTGADDSGAAYLFAIPAPQLSIRRDAPDSVSISWLAPAPGFELQESAVIANSPWIAIISNFEYNGTNFTYRATPLTGNRYFRLQKQ